jgi:hypothetical protein
MGAPVFKDQSNYYVDLSFEENDKFLKIVKDIDYLAMIDISENSELWYGQGYGQVPLIKVEQEYIPTIKYSCIYNSVQSMKLKISHDKIEFFDQDGIIVPYQLIKEDYEVIPMLELSAIYRDNGYIWADWELPQIRVTLPDLIGCQLNDPEEGKGGDEDKGGEDEDEGIPEEEFLDFHN